MKKDTAWKCDLCGLPVEIGSAPFCRDRHAQTQPHKIFKPYEVNIDGRKILIDSLQTATRIERDYERANRDAGLPGRIAFHAFHFDRSNRDRNAFDGEGWKPPKWRPREGISQGDGIPDGE